MHGLIKEGSQHIVINEFDKQNEFYKLWRAETTLSNLAEAYKNSYVIGVFACCRQKYDPNVKLRESINMVSLNQSTQTSLQ